MSGDHDRYFSILVLGAISTGVFNTNALPRIKIGADVWGESSIMTVVVTGPFIKNLLHNHSINIK
jgi:hypothetical protein